MGNTPQSGVSSIPVSSQDPARVNPNSSHRLSRVYPRTYTRKLANGCRFHVALWQAPLDKAAACDAKYTGTRKAGFTLPLFMIFGIAVTISLFLPSMYSETYLHLLGRCLLEIRKSYNFWIKHIIFGSRILHHFNIEKSIIAARKLI